jgi:hypothetical protein
MPRGEPSTECSPRSKPRRDRTEEHKVTPTREVLGSGLLFRSMVAALIKSADLLKVQAHWPPFDSTQGGEHAEPRPERLAPRTSSRE